MMTPPNGWHIDGSRGAYSNDDNLFSAIKGVFWDTPKAIIQLLVGGKEDPIVEPVAENKKGCSIFVFGPIGAGKTTLLEKLGASVTTAGIGTATERYASFYVNVCDKKILIDAGEDVGGDSWYLRNGTIEDKLKSKDKIVFVFDARKFLNINNKSYRGVVMSRLFDLYNAFSYRNKIFIIASRLDTLGNDKNYIENEIRKQLIGKPYKDILNQSFGAYNLTKNSDIQSIINNVFNSNLNK